MCKYALDHQKTTKRVYRLAIQTKLNQNVAKLEDARRVLDEMIERFNVERLYSYRFDVGSGKSESIYEHTLKTVKNFFYEKQFYPLEDLGLRNKISVEAVLVHALLVHDSGKSYAYLLKAPEKQSYYNNEIMVPLLHSFKSLTTKEKRLARSLVSHSSIGGVLQGEYSYTAFQRMIYQESKRMNMSPEDYYMLSKVFFISDAGAYDILVNTKKVFSKRPNYPTKITSANWREFEKLFLAPKH